MTGYLHSIESLGTVDGPGMRTIFFLQGCALRCQYCHNPDTWAAGGSAITTEEVVRQLKRYQPYHKRTGGGVTFSGGEPLLQPQFLAETLAACKKNGIHTCIDTAGVGLGDYVDILHNTDLVLLDVKHFEPEAYHQITGQPFSRFTQFVQALADAGTPIWVRHVVVPGLTDGVEHIKKLQNYIHTIPNVQRVQLLPYHSLGVYKHKALGLQYPLENVPDIDKELCKTLEQAYFSVKKE